MRKMLRFIQNNLDKKSSLGIMFVLILLETTIVIAVSSKTANLVNSIIEKEGGNIFYHLAIFLIVIGIYLMVRYTRAMLSKRMVAEFEKNVYEVITRRVANLSLLNIYKIGKGTIISLLMNEIRQIKSYMMYYLGDLIYEPFLFIWIFIYLYGVTPFFALTMTALMLLTIVISYLASNSLSIINIQRNEDTAKQLTRQKEIFSNVVALKLYQNDDYLSRRNEEASIDILNSSRRYIRKKVINYFPSLINEYLPVAIAVVGGVALYRNGRLNFGEFVAILQLFTSVSLPMSKYAATIVETKNTMETIKHFESILINRGEKREIEETSLFCEKSQFVYEISNLSFGYSEELLLRDISLKIAKNEHIAIVGKTGAGKSTFINILLGAITEYKGNVSFYGNEIKTIAQEDVWKHIAYVDQNRYLMSGTIAYNLFQDNYVDTENIEDILKKTNLNKDIEKFEDGLKTFVVNAGANLSGGQKEKIAIGRAIFKDSDILIFDEPSSALDEESELCLINTLDMCKDKTVIIVTHRKEMLAKCDRIYKVDEEKINEVTYEAIIKNI